MQESNENTIYECSADNTKRYGSNNVPEVCPVCGAEGKIEGADETPLTITESEAQEAIDGAITRDEAIAQGIDVEKVEAEATPVEVVPDAPEATPETPSFLDESTVSSEVEAPVETASSFFGARKIFQTDLWTKNFGEIFTINLSYIFVD